MRAIGDHAHPIRPDAKPEDSHQQDIQRRRLPAHARQDLFVEHRIKRRQPHRQDQAVQREAHVECRRIGRGIDGKSDKRRQPQRRDDKAHAPPGPGARRQPVGQRPRQHRPDHPDRRRQQAEPHPDFTRAQMIGLHQKCRGKPHDPVIDRRLQRPHDQAQPQRGRARDHGMSRPVGQAQRLQEIDHDIAADADNRPLQRMGIDAQPGQMQRRARRQRGTDPREHDHRRRNRHQRRTIARDDAKTGPLARQCPPHPDRQHRDQHGKGGPKRRGIGRADDPVAHSAHRLAHQRQQDRQRHARQCGQQKRELPAFQPQRRGMSQAERMVPAIRRRPAEHR